MAQNPAEGEVCHTFLTQVDHIHTGCLSRLPYTGDGFFFGPGELMDDKMICVQQKARWLAADMDTPISLYTDCVGQDEGILLESAEVDGRWGRYSVLLSDFALVLSCRDGCLTLDIRDSTLNGLSRFQGEPFVSGLRNVMQALMVQPPEGFADLPPITRALYGYFGFELAGLFTARLSRVLPPSEVECTLVLPGTTLVFDHLYNRLCQLSLHEHRPLTTTHTGILHGEGSDLSALPVASRPGEEGYKAWVCDIKERLRAGEAIQVVPSVRFSCACADDPFFLYRRMRRLNASPYMFYMHLPQINLFGSSPEVMVSAAHGSLTLSPIAGTRRRGVDEREDQFLASELLNDPKERAEHVMLVDLGRNDLGRIAAAGSVSVERYMQIERFSHVMHLTSCVRARLKDTLDALDIIAATFPAGTVSGAPKVRALELIRELEGQPRGPYAGAIGWLGLDHDSVNLDLGITIRSMWQRDGQLFWQAGGGIVHDSDPELEWKEVCNKSKIMRTVLADEGEAYVPSHR